MAAIAFSRAIGPVALDVVIRESHSSDIEITKNPIETGAEVNDHAYIKPKRVTLEIADSAMVETWQALKALQESRAPFTLVTGLDIYTNMLIESLEADRDKDWSSALRGLVQLRQVIIVDTTYATSVDGDTDAASAKGGQPGGKKSSRAAKPSPSRSTDAVTSDRAAGQVQRGDNPATSVPTTGGQNRSILKSLITPETTTNSVPGGRPAP